MKMKKMITLRSMPKTLYGRTIYTENDALSLCWSLSGFGVRFKGKSAMLHFDTFEGEQPVYVLVKLDGVSTKYAIATGKEKILLEDLSEDVHTMEFRRLSADGEPPLLVAGMSLEGEFLDPPELPSLRVEFFGDSITCGYGNLGGPEEKAFYTFEQDPTKSFAGLTGAKLGADFRIVAISGNGVVKNWRGLTGTPIPEFFYWASKRGRVPHDFTSWIPHVVVINAGTNDGGGKVPDDEFYEGADKFLDAVREKYPDAHIFWLYGMMGLRYDEVLASLFEKRGMTDDKLCYIPVRPIREFPDETGSNGHPNVKANVRAAEILTEAIRKALKI